MIKEIRGVTALLACVMLASGLGSCTSTKNLHKQSEKTSTVRDTASTQKTETRERVTAKADSSGKAERTEKATETAANEAVEEIEATTYDPATGRVVAVTKTKRRITGTVAKASESTAKTQAETSRRLDTEKDASVEHAFTSHSELTRETKQKDLQKETKTSVIAWAGGIAWALAIGSIALALLKPFAPVLGGGPIWWLVALIRRNKQQQPGATV